MRYIKACLLAMTLVASLNLTGCYVDDDDRDHWRHRDDDRRWDHRHEEWREHHDRW